MPCFYRFNTLQPIYFASLFHRFIFFALTFIHHRKYYNSKRLSSLKSFKVSQWVRDVPFVRAIQDRFIFSKYIYVTLLKFFESESRELTEEHLARMDPLDADCADLVCRIQTPFLFSFFHFPSSTLPVFLNSPPFLLLPHSFSTPLLLPSSSSHILTLPPPCRTRVKSQATMPMQ